MIAVQRVKKRSRICREKPSHPATNLPPRLNTVGHDRYMPCIRPVSWLAVILLHTAFPVAQWRLHGFVWPTVAGAAPDLVAMIRNRTGLPVSPVGKEHPIRHLKRSICYRT